MSGTGGPLEDLGGGSHSSQHEEGEGSWLVSYADMMTLLVGFFVILLSFSSIDQEKFEEVKKAATQEFGGNYQVPYGELSDRIKQALNSSGFGDQFAIKQTPFGVEISFQGTAFFDLGSAELRASSSQLLEKLMPVLDSQAKDFNYVIEGHTDDIPTANDQFRSNWELSSVRACRVLAAFEGHGVSKSRMTAVGYGDARPVVPNRDSAGTPIERNRAQNRRVVIKILKDAVSVTGMAAGAAPDPAVPPAKGD